MTDTATSSTYRIGQVRYKYLDMSNVSFARGEYEECEGWIDAFLETIKDETKEAKEIEDEFNKIDAVRRDRIKDLEAEVKDLGYLEQHDIKMKGHLDIRTNAVHDMKNCCWLVAKKYGLFDE